MAERMAMSRGSDFGRLAGRAGIVTGASRGIGAAVVRSFVDAGAGVLIADILDDEGTALAAELGDAAGYVHLDVRKRDDWETAVALCAETFGLPPTLLVHNAGVMTPGTVAGLDEDALSAALDVNLFGPVIGTQVCLPGMIEAGGGSVVVMSSIASMSVGPGFIPYAVSKAGNAAYARAAARELGEYGIRVNSLHPGGVDTPMNSGSDFAALDKDAWFGRMTIPRIGRPDEIAAAALFLASDESSYITGTQLVVDGGQLLGPRSAWKS
ncbi:SDR family NAD(P)-dependent oxidoreductase [Streptomyces sp. NPDC059627]